jgi:2-polyprenyl-3-methyl-5-hydroxy-6-metoxy-1,4-benzoquinol methylase
MSLTLEHNIVRRLSRLPLVRNLKPFYFKHLNKVTIARYLSEISKDKDKAIDLKDKQIIAKILPGVRTIADIGCEGAKITAYLSLCGYNVTGVDLDARMIKYVKGLIKKNNYDYQINFTIANIYNLPFTDNHFDCVICSETIEHLKYPKTAIAELVRIAKRQIILTTPVLYSYNSPDHEQHFADKDIEELFEDYDFEYHRIITKVKDIELGQMSFLITVIK